MEEEKIKKFNHFRTLCLKNAEQLLTSARTLLQKKVNHIVFHLAVLSLEEVGKTIVGWMKVNTKEEWGKETFNYKIDDHVKKLFWVTLLKEKINKKDIDEIHSLASFIHTQRLESLYTRVDDTVDGSDKITQRQAQFAIDLATNRLDYLHAFAPATAVNTEGDQDLAWFESIFDDVVKRNFIFNEKSLAKFSEFGNSKEWIQWLRTTFEEEAKRMEEMLKQELAKPKELKDNPEPKWKIRFTIVSPSHSIRPKTLQEFSKANDLFKLSKGRDVHTLTIDMFLSTNTSVDRLWSDGWLNAQLFVAGLNVGSNGIFYWNVPVDTDKFYDQILDLQNNQQLLAKELPDLKFDWSEQRQVLQPLHLGLAVRAYYYFSSCLGKNLFEPIQLYIMALGLMAKIDIHMRVEPQAFFHFFQAFRRALQLNQETAENFNPKEIGFSQLKELLESRTQFDQVMDLGEELSKNPNSNVKITLTEVMAMKLYCNYYFLTLTIRKIENKKDIFLTRKVPAETT